MSSTCNRFYFQDSDNSNLKDEFEGLFHNHVWYFAKSNRTAHFWDQTVPPCSRFWLDERYFFCFFFFVCLFLFFVQCAGVNKGPANWTQSLIRLLPNSTRKRIICGEKRFVYNSLSLLIKHDLIAQANRPYRAYFHLSSKRPVHEMLCKVNIPGLGVNTPGSRVLSLSNVSAKNKEMF